MIIDFNKIEENKNEKFNGGIGHFDARIFNDGVNKILMGRLEKNNSIGLHKHDGTSEIIYVISGRGIMETDGKEEVLTKGMVTYCEMGHSHTFKNVDDEDLCFFAVVPNHKAGL